MSVQDTPHAIWVKAGEDISGNKTNYAIQTKIKNTSSEAIPVTVVSQPNALIKNIFIEVTAVAQLVETTIVSHTAVVGKTTFLVLGEFSGTNIATYRIKINGLTQGRKDTYFSGDFHGSFSFSGEGDKGLEVSSGDVILISVIHERSDVGDFSGRILVIEET